MNRRKALTAALFSLSLIAPTAMMAQYPQLNADARKTYDVLMSTARAHSDSAWAVAKPIVDKEAREGRPYVPGLLVRTIFSRQASLHSQVPKVAECTPPADAEAR